MSCAKLGRRYRPRRPAALRPRTSVGRGTIATILKRHGIEPAPERQKRTTWQEFLKAHWDVLAAADFFTVGVWTAMGLTRYLVLFVIELATRRVHIAGIASEPDSAWVVQCGRQLTDPVDGFLARKRCLLHDRDPLFTEVFRETLAATGVETVRRCLQRHFALFCASYRPSASIVSRRRRPPFR